MKITRWTFFKAVLMAAMLALAFTEASFAQSIPDQFPDDPDNPRFWHGGSFWTIFSVALMATFASISRNTWITAAAGLAPLFYAVANGVYSPIVILMIFAVAVGATLTFIMFRR